ncbi:TIGR04190 family B12-binding domain/radical SAM domain protein [Verrucomicrobiota bacterium]
MSEPKLEERSTMAKTDLILLHAPSVYDFRKRPTLHGPVSDVIPSTQIFEMYPIGFMTILSYLRKHGYSVRIINVALKMLNRPRFDVDRLIRSLKPLAFGVDLHWLVHAQGSLELAAIVKKYHPDIPVIVGGLSASYFHEELIRYPQVDFVVRGDSTEEAVHQLLSVLKNGGSLRDVPNLAWKENGEVRINDMSYVPADLDNFSFDYREIMRSCIRHFDILGHLPFKLWSRYPILAQFTCRGCVHSCPVCGGSSVASRKISGRTKPAYRKPEMMAEDIYVISQHIKAPIIILGDILQPGEDYARRLLSSLGGLGIRNHLALEFFTPPPKEILELAHDTVPNFNIQMSPESHDEHVRRAFGRPYSNEDLERSISDALECGCRRFDLFFMIGIPEQNVESVRDTIRYCEELMDRYCGSGRGNPIQPYISPLAPFLDPGSAAFDDPDKYGYRLFHRSLEEHRQALLAPSWKHTLNYETKWMSRDELVNVTYEAAEELNTLKLKYGLLNRRDARKISEQAEMERELIREIDGIVAMDDEADRERRLTDLMAKFNSTGPSTICRKDEMNWPSAFLRFSPLRILRALIMSEAN